MSHIFLNIFVTLIIGLIREMVVLEEGVMVLMEANGPMVVVVAVEAWVVPKKILVLT